MSIAGSIIAESVYYEEPYTVPGPCKTCCLRCPCPNLITTILFLIGTAGFCLGVVLASDETVRVFLWNSALKGTLSDWLLYVKIGVAIATAIMALLAVVMLAMAYLGTGATRKEFVCRFRTREKGRCQTAVILIIAYILLLIWIIVTLITLIPTFFFSVQAHGICRSARDTINSNYYYECLDLRQWGLLDYDRSATSAANPLQPSNDELKFYMCDEDLLELCLNSNVLIYYVITLASAVLILITLIHYLINFSANYAKLRDRFKDGYVDKRTGTYLTRTQSLRGSKRSLAGTRASLRGSRGSVRHVGASNPQITNGGLATASSASTLRIAAYKNEALKSSGEDLYMRDMKQYNVSNYGNNYDTSGAVRTSGSNYGAQDFNSPAVTDDIPPLKAAYLESFAEPPDAYDQRDRFTSQASYEANVPVDPYLNSNIDNDRYNKANSYNDAYGTNLDTHAGYGSKEFVTRRSRENVFSATNGYDVNGSSRENNRNSQGSNNQSSGYPEPYISLQSTESSSRERNEYFI